MARSVCDNTASGTFVTTAVAETGDGIKMTVSIFFTMDDLIIKL